MLFTDTYKTITAESRGLYKDRGSRFIAIAMPVTSHEEIRSKLEALRKEYHDARHHCYAWVLAPDRLAWRVNDDGEPSGTAGRPILGQI
ncbi:MAG: YigZ family protein, partial [Bacteroidales bacterium]|nr:YigZ family protein [Bacteroidales bacterium]